MSKDKITTSSIAKVISKEYDLPYSTALKIVTSVVQMMVVTLIKGKILSLKHFFSIKYTVRPPKEVKLNERSYLAPERVYPKVVWSRNLIDRLRGVTETDRKVERIKKEDDPIIDLGLLKDIKKSLKDE